MSCHHGYATSLLAPRRASQTRLRAIVRRHVVRQRHLSTHPVSPTPEIFDIVCVGGGPAGLSLLNALNSSPSAQGLKIALIDGQTLSASNGAANPAVYSNRCSSLTPASVRFLRRTGVWEHVDTTRTRDYTRMHVWDGVSGAKISFDPEDRSSGILRSISQVIPGFRVGSDQQEDTIATMCENVNLTSALLSSLSKADIEILDKTKVSDIALGRQPEDKKEVDLSQWPVVSLASGRSMAARLLIGADGANSPVRQFANIPAHGWDYNAQGVVATVTVDRTSELLNTYTAYQRFLPTGPIALLPLPDDKMTLVWSTTPQIAAMLKTLPSADFVALVNGAFRLLTIDLNYIYSATEAISPTDEVAWRETQTDSKALGSPTTLPRVIAVQEGSIASFPLRMRHADVYTGHRVALIGDAAHTIHPLAGQGLNLGLADAEALSRRIVDGLETGMDIGTNWCLDGYNSDRWAANNAVMGVCDKLNKLYGTDSAPVVAARSLGLGLVDRLGPLKGLIMSAAAGAR